MLFSKHVVVVNNSYSISQKKNIWMKIQIQNTIHHWSGAIQNHWEYLKKEHLDYCFLKKISKEKLEKQYVNTNSF